MKNKLHVFLCIIALSVLPIWAGDDSKIVGVERRLREIDLSLSLRQYERVKMEMFEIILKLELLSTEEEMSEAVRKKRAELLGKRYEILGRRADELRASALQLEHEITVGKAK
jgi:hypothetical protein